MPLIGGVGMSGSKARVCLIVVALAVLAAPVSRAGVYGDDLSKCLVAGTTAKDKTDLVRWIFATAALHPDVSSIASVTPDQRTEMTKNVGLLYQRLLTETCRTQFRDAVKNEGKETLSASFAVLGGVAMRALMGDPAVTRGMGDLDAYVSDDKIKAVIDSTGP